MGQHIYISQSRIAGTGCFAARTIQRGEHVGEYIGDILPNDVAYARYADREETYLFMINDDEVIDGDVPDNMVKYINHSCEPNCDTIQEGKRIFYVALRDIAAHEELTFDYKLEVEPWVNDPCICRCGANRCRGTMREVTILVQSKH